MFFLKSLRRSSDTFRVFEKIFNFRRFHQCIETDIHWTQRNNELYTTTSNWKIFSSVLGIKPNLSVMFFCSVDSVTNETVSSFFMFWKTEGWKFHCLVLRLHITQAVLLYFLFLWQWPGSFLSSYSITRNLLSLSSKLLDLSVNIRFSTIKCSFTYATFFSVIEVFFVFFSLYCF